MKDRSADRDFVVLFGSACDGGIEVSVVESPAGASKGVFRLPGELGEWSPLRLDLARAGRHLVAEDDVALPPFRAEDIGRTLFTALFDDPIDKLYAESRGLVGPENVLRLKLRFWPGGKSPEEILVKNLPWELLWDPVKLDFLALDHRTPVVRSLDVKRPVPSVVLPKALRVLVVISEPEGLPHLELRREQERIEKAWRTAQVHVLPDGRLDTLREALRQGPVHCLHFMGHGDLDPTLGKARLFFESADRSPDPVTGETLACLLKGAESLRLVFLNACETARSPMEMVADSLSGMSSALVLGGIPAVLAMQLPISDDAAIELSRVVHERLAAGDALESAVAEGRKALFTTYRASPEWAIPVLFSRLPDGRLFDPRRPGDFTLAGAWKAKIPFSDSKTQWDHHTMTLDQDGMDVWGNSVCDRGGYKGLRYSLQGRFRGETLTSFYTIDDETLSEQGAMVVRLAKGGRALKGTLIYYDNDKEEISTVDCEWKKT